MRYLIILLNFITFTAFAQSSVSTKLARLKNAPDNERQQLFIELSQYYTLSQADSAVHYANEGMHLAEKRNDQNGLAVMLLQLGRINAAYHHDNLARRFYNEALSISRRLQNGEGVANAYKELGLLDGRDRSISMAAKDLDEAAKLYHDSRDSIGVAKSYQRLGKVYEEKGDIEKALSYYLRALTQYEKRNRKPEEYYVLLDNVGNLYEKKHQNKLALNYLQKGINTSAHTGDRDAEVYLLDEEGRVYQDEGQQTKALSIYKEALEIAKKFRRPEEQAKALINIASVLKEQNAAASMNDLKTAMAIAQHLKQPQLKAHIYEAMAGIYRQEKNYREAMNAIQEQHTLLDSLLQADTAKDIAALDSSYALESSYAKIGRLQKINQQEHTILLLGWIILTAVLVILVILWVYLRKVRRLNGELKNSNKIKDTLFSVIGHDLKGPAGSAVQLFEMMETEEFTEAELRAMIAELKKQTNASLELLQALFEWGKAQLQGITVNPVDFNPNAVIERCISLLSQQAAQKHIRINNNTPDNLRLHADANHFEFVIRNIISNAIKFSYDGSSITVGAQSGNHNKEIVFAISDEGIGISKEQQQVFLTSNLKVSFGTAREKGSGLGLMLTKDFIRANKGHIWLESEEKKGTTFYISLPAA